MEEHLRKLELKKALLVDQLLMLSEVSDSFYLRLGKLEVEIILLKKQILDHNES